MSWYYDNDSISNYYTWYKQNKELERARKIKAKKEKIRKEKLEKERIRIEKKRLREEQIENQRQERRQQKENLKTQRREIGYRPTYTKINPLKRAKNSRDLTLCKEIYEKAKQGISTYKIAKEYDLHPNTILRHKYEYEYYLSMKTLDNKVE
jgi:hypothetical protein